MAAKMKAKTAMVTMVGEDSFGRDTVQNFVRQGIDICLCFFQDRTLLFHHRLAHVGATEKASTGVAPIAVDAQGSEACPETFLDIFNQGQNSIIIVNGANDFLTPELVSAAESTIRSSKVLLTQLEIKVVQIFFLFAAMMLTVIARVNTPSPEDSQGGADRQVGLPCIKEAINFLSSIFNPAPATSHLEAEFYSLPTILCLNEVEAQMLTGVAITDINVCSSTCSPRVTCLIIAACQAGRADLVGARRSDGHPDAGGHGSLRAEQYCRSPHHR
jgi:ribokinase